ncbi:hypothetical protein AC249_AIPGENE7201 [Exaiptasia diaphana]|nr:hypothetical protein AC249_AIPGENE7201 [Exaiptasia diaphana]
MIHDRQHVMLPAFELKSSIGNTHLLVLYATFKNDVVEGETSKPEIAKESRNGEERRGEEIINISVLSPFNFNLF